MDEVIEKKKRLSKDVKITGFISDVLTLVGGTAFAQILTILSAPVLTRLYKPEDFGIWALYISITSIISIIACMRYEYSIMLPESNEEAVNLLGLSFLAALIISGLTIPFIWYFKESIVNILNSPQIGSYLWLVPPFIFVNGLFLALNNWNSRTKLFKRLSISRICSSVSTLAAQIGMGLTVNTPSAGGLIGGSIAGQYVATFVLGCQIWRDDKKLIKKSIRWEKICEGFKRYRSFPLIDSWSALMNIISWQLPTFLLAAFFTPAVVGFYSLGFRLLQLPMSFIGSSISQVFFQRASKAKSEGTLDYLVESVFRLLVIIGMFPMLIITIIGSDIFTLIFGNDWTEAGVYAQILSLWAFIWLISSPLSTIYIVMEKQQFGFQYSFFNLITRILSLYIGGLLGNARLALILFSISGILVYSYLCLKMLFYSGIENSKVIKILYSNFCLFIPVGIILIALKIAQVNHIIIVLCSCVAIIIYYIYIMNTDMQLKQIISQFIPNRIIN
ncbi:Membrane protein involved in the export of O-antigen and teichoic acid [Methanosarcina thermophila]|jgi:lipopolysaccharide exporter|uniref:Membrane protein involved in the export of O-antigen and teichoic acid n=2 Tax=Methanosarcina thermophila TaxID=2210 RepID=A0A1I6XNG2_METTE|nr:oligosaccharide flippase family protein [Methanosarcina thermophila]AKB12932.1 O-antigen flippase Wzx [Methanosarcina thermophila TM-1]SFT39935.1 Membrane protein involved in the export of O-antigen and teichoic acid [Methanosarcina thermophila]HOA68142.1 oligosaccharide flippase family protein [Methanosarcina thermophila]HOQ66895.1 oligosaccharide flippase family protein [Methanosarcina thermophila]HPT80439.1 oligosaccharide flippase family protein [Methanosarcina thermophila]